MEETSDRIFIVAKKLMVQVSFVLFNQKWCSLFIVILILFCISQKGRRCVNHTNNKKEMKK